MAQHCWCAPAARPALPRARARASSGPGAMAARFTADARAAAAAMEGEALPGAIRASSARGGQGYAAPAKVGTGKDQALSFCGDGGFLLVKSSTVLIQGRSGSQHTEGLAVAHPIVADVPFLYGRKFEVGALDTDVLTVVLVPVMSDQPSFCTGAGFTLSYVALCVVAEEIENQAPSFFGVGDFWLLKRSTVQTVGTRYTEGLAATHQVVEGGPFLYGHIIEVGTFGTGALTVDKVTVLLGLTSFYTAAGFTLSYGAQDVAPDGLEIEVGTHDGGELSVDKLPLMSGLSSFSTGAGSTVSYDAQDEVAHGDLEVKEKRIVPWTRPSASSWGPPSPWGWPRGTSSLKAGPSCAATSSKRALSAVACSGPLVGGECDSAHIISFGDGGFGKVKNSTVQIQGRFLEAKHTEGLAALPVMSGFPSFSTGAGSTLRYAAQDKVADEAPEVKEKRIVLLALPLGVLDRISATKHTEGLPATHLVVVVGPFMNGHVIKVGTLVAGVISVDK